MKKTDHKPVFRGYKFGSTTVCAYCPKCDAVLRDYLQPKCENCGWDIDWQKVRDKSDS